MLIINFYNKTKEKIGTTFIDRDEVKLIEVNKEELVIEFYDMEPLYFEITSLEDMTEKVKKYMLSEAGVLELEAYVKKKIGEEIDELFLKSGDINEE
ncbi:MAG: hypothetical protein BWX59_02474 [Bacteroidetes bacterium ADurb.Bin028]|nr:MAG: hypothetical protein BWX59_02474 [Bacteroidetes bacterium ADurb.Bin028]